MVHLIICTLEKGKKVSHKCHVLFEWLLNTFVHSNEEIGEIEKIACVIDDIPPDRKEVVQLPENCSADHKNQVVKHRTVDDA